MNLEQGDIVIVDFNPSVGHESAKSRPAIVVSGYGFNSRSSLVAVVPVTSGNNG
ncbi:MAG: type II toxin-antitoxin system PemK/MazF family toxin, partial [Gordonibacter sp.]